MCRYNTPQPCLVLLVREVSKHCCSSVSTAIAAIDKDVYMQVQHLASLVREVEVVLPGVHSVDLHTPAAATCRTRFACAEHVLPACLAKRLPCNIERHCWLLPARYTLNNFNRSNRLPAFSRTDCTAIHVDIHRQYNPGVQRYRNEPAAYKADIPPAATLPCPWSCGRHKPKSSSTDAAFGQAPACRIAHAALCSTA
jgi:hypothetical protein